MLFLLNQTLQIIKQILMFIHTSFSVLDFIGLELGCWSKNQSNMMLKEWKCLKCKFLSQVKVVNQEFVSFMSPPSGNLSPDKFDLLG